MSKLEVVEAKAKEPEFIIYGIKHGTTKEWTLRHIEECKKYPESLGCPRCRTRLSLLSSNGVTMCLICHIRFTFDDKKRILPPIAACHNKEHHWHHLHCPYTTTTGAESWVHECTECWIIALKDEDAKKTQEEASQARLDYILTKCTMIEDKLDILKNLESR